MNSRYQGYIKEDTAYIEVNPAIRQYFGVKGLEQDPNGLEIILKNKHVLSDLINWEQSENHLTTHKNEYDKMPPEQKAAFDEIKTYMDIIELKLSQSNVMLDTSSGISVRINPNYPI